jgi:hypothetical protein
MTPEHAAKNAKIAADIVAYNLSRIKKQPTTEESFAALARIEAAMEQARLRRVFLAP